MVDEIADLIAGNGLLNEEQSKAFVDLVLSKHTMLRAMRIRCLRCGASWPWVDDDLACCCSSNIGGWNPNMEV